MTTDTIDDSKQRDEGWYKVFNAAKWHYFTADGRSLCRRWGLIRSGPGGLEPDIYDQVEPSKDECVACWRKRRAARATEGSK